jgi:geranylgeranyl transferase type-2 subunit beta
MTLLRELHANFLNRLDQDRSTLESFLAAPLRMGGVYWAVGAARLLNQPLPSSEEILAFIKSCRNPDGGYSPDTGHDSHATSTHYALLTLKMLGQSLDTNETAETTQFFRNLQQRDGGISGDRWGECDLRFAYDAAASLKLLGEENSLDFKALRAWIRSCRNFDGGYAPAPEQESHAAYTFCAIGALSLSGGVEAEDEPEKTAWWLAERQTVHGGFNGRPEKAPDVCYSWWILASLAMLGKAHWINQDALREFVLRSQDEEAGGISDRPGFAADVFHTFFGLAALSLIGKDGLTSIDPRLAIPVLSK